MNNNYPLTSKQNILNTENYHMIFSINDKKYSLNIQNILEVINMPEIEIPSQMPKSIIGIYDYKGLIIKVIDLSVILGFKPKPFSINNQLIIVFTEGNYLAVHTEKIIDIVQINSENIQSIPINNEDSIVKGIYINENDSINIIDIKNVEKYIQDNKNTPSDIDYSVLFPEDEKSKNILHIRSNQNKQKHDTFSFPFESNNINQYILFKLDNYNYYLDLKYIKEFYSFKRLNITKLPYTQDYIKGIINIKGEFLLVIDLKKFLNTESSSTKQSNNIIVVQGKNFNIALLVDEIKYIKNLNNIKPDNLYSDYSKYIYAEFMEEDKLYSILNFEKIITDERLYINS